MNWPSLTAKRVCCVVVAALCFAVFFLSRFILLRICICTFLFHLIFYRGITFECAQPHFVFFSHESITNSLMCICCLLRSIIALSLDLTRSTRHSHLFYRIFLLFPIRRLEFYSYLKRCWTDFGFAAAAALGSMVVCAVKRVFLINVHKETFVEMKYTQKQKPRRENRENNTFFSVFKSSTRDKKKLRRAFILCMALFFSWT